MFRNTTDSNASITNNTQHVTYFRLLFACLSVLTLAFTIAAPTMAQTRGTQRPDKTAPASDENTLLLTPLAKSDPRAKLDAELLNVPSKPAPFYVTSSAELGAEADAVVEYDVKSKLSTSRFANPVTVPEFVQEALEAGQASLGASSGANLSQDNSDVRGRVPSTESVIGSDGRIKITNTTVYPWRAITKLYMKFPNGLTYSCSGTMINAKYVLTAGHCIHSKADGGWATTVTVIPGLDGSYKPYGQTYATYLRSYTGWTVSESSDHDFGLVTLASPLGSSTGWLGLKAYSSVDGLTSNIAGYPGDKDSGLGLYYHWGPINSSNAYRVFHQIDTYPGQSGSGIYYIEPGPLRYVFAVHTNGAGSGSYNSGCRINSSKFSSIVSWMASGY